jgi:hypothetical protein
MMGMRATIGGSLFCRSLRLCIVLSCCLGFYARCMRAMGQTREMVPVKLITHETQQAIDEGLAYLVEQQLEDGSFGTNGYRRNVAICSLVGLAYLSSGSTPGRGPYGDAIDKCMDYLLVNTSDSGLISAPTESERGPMYGHGFATLFLCETYGMSLRKDLRDRLSDAVGLIVRTQNDEGGWRYQPRPQDADLSVTVCQVMALRAARNAGFAVPKKTIDQALGYVKACQNVDGGFRYMRSGEALSAAATNALIHGGGQFARSAAGVVAYTNGGIYSGKELSQGLSYLDEFLPASTPAHSKISLRTPYYFYGHYYAVQAMWHAGEEHWLTWYPAIRNQLLARQLEGGSWDDAICPEYGTAMACIILQVPNNYLPILQR